ncbi:MAG TPA: hypothetical protein VI548_02115 [Chitinophagaceae bacterium]|nr:hypothetical protein [Chitinophagaceae bacterium]
MEVHAHTHTPRKKWTHYFWEFLMLFMAVSAGFLVENQREHYIEQQRAKVYATNLYEDLKKDTARLNNLIMLTEITSKKLDTLCLYINEKSQRGISNGMLYWYARFTTHVLYFSANNATLEELKGSGNLRLMKNQVAQQISLYDKNLSELAHEYSLSKTEFAKMEELYFRIFDYYISAKLYPGWDPVPGDSAFRLNPPLIEDDPKLMKEFIGWVTFEKGIYREQIQNYLNTLKVTATELLALLKKEYRLK